MSNCRKWPHPGLILILGCLCPSLAQAQTFTDSLLVAELTRFQELSGGIIGVAAIHLESGRRFAYNSQERFPMASTYKVPIAVRILQRIDAGELSLDSMIVVQRYNLSPGSGTISRLLDDPGVILSVHNLLELMLQISDNSATDLLLALAGGAEAVNAMLRDLDIDGMQVNRSTLQLIADYLGITDLPPLQTLSPENFRALYQQTTDSIRSVAASLFNRDPQDTSTPVAMANLLVKIWTGQALSDSSTARLIDIMRRCETGEARLKGLLPPETVVAHKTGTIGGTTNDVGVIELPHGSGHLIVAAFIKESNAEYSQRERVLAHISRTLYDYFLYLPLNKN